MIRILNIPIVSILATVLIGACASQPKPLTSARADTASAAVQYAVKLVGTPYRYGGNTIKGFDCSGLIQYSYARAGVIVPRTTHLQRRHSRAIRRAQMRAGDLVFFNQEGKRSSHVGLYIGGNRFVHAPSTGKRVHVSTLTTRYWQRHFAGARRLNLN